MTPSEVVEAALRAKLETMASGEALPSVRAIAAEHRVANATVQKALGRLKAEGLIGSRRGWAVYKI